MPEGTKDAYAGADAWKEFYSIIEVDLTGIEAAATGTQSRGVSGYYTTGGQETNAPVNGVNIIRYKDGTTKKILVK